MTAIPEPTTVRGIFPPGNWCLQCHKYQHEPPTEKCKNPMWHDLPLEGSADDSPFPEDAA